jgi:hypothetical protein
MTILNSAPTHSTPILNTTDGLNKTTGNLTVHPQGASDADGDAVKNITDFRLDGNSITVLNMPFEGESDASTTKDYGTSDNNGTVTGATFSNTAGHDGFGAYTFVSDDYIDLGTGLNNYLKSDQAFSAAAWIKTSDVTNQNIISNADWASPFIGVEWVILTTGTMGIDIVQSGSKLIRERTTAAVNDGNWHHVAYTYDGSEDAAGLTLYIDGSASATTVSFNNIDATVTSTTNLQIGARDGTNQPFNGTIDEVKVYNRTLSSEQILALYNNRTNVVTSDETNAGETWQSCVTPTDGEDDGTTTCSNTVTIQEALTAPTHDNPQLVSDNANLTTSNLTATPVNLADANGDSINLSVEYFRNGRKYDSATLNGTIPYTDVILNMPFENFSKDADTYRDYSTYKNTVEVNGSTWNSDTGYDSYGAYNFDGNDQINIADSPEQFMSAGFTVSLWANASAVDGFHTLIAKDHPGVDGEWAVQANTNGKVQFFVTENDRVNFICRDTANGAYAVDGWHQWVITWDGSTSATGLRTYKDGVRVDTTNCNNGAFAGLEDSNSPITIGKSNNDQNFMKGEIDNVLIWNTTFTASQVQEVYTNRSQYIDAKENVHSESWQTCITPTDGALDGTRKCSDTITIENVIATTPTLQNPADESNITDRSPNFNWSNSVHEDPLDLTYELEVSTLENFSSITVNQSEINETTDFTNHTITELLDTDVSYWWRVRSWDGANFSSYSTPFNFTLQSFLSITLVNDGVNFGSVGIGNSSNTSDDSPQPFLIENNGNVLVNITVTGDKFFQSGTYPGENFQFKIRENETGAFLIGQSTMTYTDMTNVSSASDIADLNWSGSNNDARIDLLVRVPGDEPAGTRNNTITFEVS